MFHPQINYSTLLIEENAASFFFFFIAPLFSLPSTPELDCGALPTQSHLFLMPLCDSHTEWIALNSPCSHFLKGFSFFYRVTSTDEIDE